MWNLCTPFSSTIHGILFFFFVLPHLLSSPSISFCAGSALTSAVFTPALHFWCWYLPPCCLAWSCPGPQPTVLCAPTPVPRPCLLILLVFPTGKQVLYRKGWGICWFNPIVQLWRWSQYSFKGCFQKIPWKCLGERENLRKNWGRCMTYIPREVRETNNWHE